MSFAQLDIYNMAIGHLGVSVEINSLTENTNAARRCRRFWDICRQKTLKDAPWPFAKNYSLLTQVTTPIPSSEYAYAYRYPANCLMMRRILNGASRVDDAQSGVPFVIGQDSDGGLIFCDMPPTAAVIPADSLPWAEYTLDVTDVTRFSADFSLALSYLLGRSVGPSLAADKTKLLQDVMGLYNEAIMGAKIAHMNERFPDEQPLSEFERSRFGFPPGVIDELNLFNTP